MVYLDTTVMVSYVNELAQGTSEKEPERAQPSWPPAPIASLEVALGDRLDEAPEREVRESGIDLEGLEREMETEANRAARKRIEEIHAGH